MIEHYSPSALVYLAAAAAAFLSLPIQADACVTGGTEAAITPLCFAGFCAIKALTTSGNDDPTK